MGNTNISSHSESNGNLKDLYETNKLPWTTELVKHKYNQHSLSLFLFCGLYPAYLTQPYIADPPVTIYGSDPLS